MESPEPQEGPESLRESFLHQTPNKEAFLPSLIYASLAAIVSLLCWNSAELKTVLTGRPEAIFEHWEWYRLFTSLLVHSNIRHLLANMLFLVPFGGLLTFYFSWRMFPLLGLLLGILTQYFSLKTYSPQTGLIGSSGLLYVLFGLWLSLYFVAETHVAKSNRLLRIIGFSLIMLIPSQFSPHVSYRTHFIGFVIGLAAGFVYALLYREDIEARNRSHRRERSMLH